MTETSTTALPRDDEQMRDLYRTHGPVLLRYLLRLTNGDRHRAEDLMQEAMLRAWRHPEALASDGQWRRPWIFTVAHNLAIDSLRTTRPLWLTGAALDDHPEERDPVDQMLISHDVRAAVGSLPERLRVVMEEVYLRERSGQETAESLGLPIGTIKSRTFYALRALRAALTEGHPAPGS